MYICALVGALIKLFYEMHGATIKIMKMQEFYIFNMTFSCFLCICFFCCNYIYTGDFKSPTLAVSFTSRFD